MSSKASGKYKKNLHVSTVSLIIKKCKTYVGAVSFTQYYVDVVRFTQVYAKLISWCLTEALLSLSIGKAGKGLLFK